MILIYIIIVLLEYYQRFYILSNILIYLDVFLQDRYT